MRRDLLEEAKEESRERDKEIGKIGENVSDRGLVGLGKGQRGERQED